MKKITTLLFVLILAFSIFAIPVSANGMPEVSVISSRIIYLNNGSYIIETIRVSEPTRSTVSGTKEIAYNTSSGTAWVYRVHGTFFYNGSTSYATAASASYTIYQSGWTCTSSSSGYSGATAYANGIFRSPTISNYSAGPKLTCSVNGSLS